MSGEPSGQSEEIESATSNHYFFSPTALPMSAPPGPQDSLIDGHGRRIDYLRLSLTDRCDLRCQYCIPKGFRQFEKSEHWLLPREIEHVVAAFVAMGIERVRLTGGEPLTRKDVIAIASRIGSLTGIKDLSLTTNGTQLERHAYDLKQAGVRRLNISLDTLDAHRFEEITGHNALRSVIAGIEKALATGFSLIKINMVLMEDINVGEADAMVRFCLDRGAVLRFIEPMPMGTGKRFRPANLEVIRRRLQDRFALVDGIVPGGGPARYLQSRDGKFSVGFITPLSRHFCATCNRVRLSADGTLFTCLGESNSYPLGPSIRAGANQHDLIDLIRGSLACKPAHHDFDTAPAKVIRIMAKTGG
jgi:GTP 3',8-cyclase